MSRVRNAGEFLLRLRRIRAHYDQVLRPRFAEIRRRYAGKPEGQFVDQSLEAHARLYIVDSLLAALNWRPGIGSENGRPNLIPEAPIQSVEKKSIRFLDYLGLERDTDLPLLIVETKRPSAPLPYTWKRAESYSEAVSRGLAGEPLKGGWDAWLRDLMDYIRSVHARTQRVPRRVVITNGDWLILFLNPLDAFLEGGNRDPNWILVFEDYTDIERRFRQLFIHLEYQQVLGETPALTQGELTFHLGPEEVDRAMHGLRLLYIEQRGLHSQYSPVIKVTPVVFLHSRRGGWLRVEAPPQEHELPRESTKLPLHLDEVQQAGKDLLAKVNHGLGTMVQPLPLARHYEDEETFDARRGVEERGADEYLVVTGDKTHYLLQVPSVLDCPYHDWSACKRLGVCNPGPIMEPSTRPRSFFRSGELHHCAHRDVNSAKAAPITSANQSRCGPRSGKEGDAFCEIWRFEQHLCCRTCAFEEVCTRTTVLWLPCGRAGLSGF